MCFQSTGLDELLRKGHASAEPKRSMGQAGKLDVNIDSVRLADGEKAALSATKSEKGGGHTGAMTAGMVGGAMVLSGGAAAGFSKP